MSGIGSRRHIVCLGLSTAALAMGLLANAPAMAQDDGNPATPQNTDGQVKNDNAIIVTGSRVGRSTFDTSSPVTVLDAQVIDDLNLNNVGEVVAQLPSNSNFFAPNNVGLGNFNVGAQLVNLRGLNPFFGTRTLTLVDTRRVVPTTTGGGVDITLMPSMLVARTETVTGGASAIYGSDAIAGVVNIILDTKLQGLKAQADFSQTWRGDGDDLHFSGAYGTGFAADRGHIVVGVEYDKQDAIGICSEVRGWCSDRYAMFTNTGYLTNGQPHYIIGDRAYSANTSLTGFLAPCTVYAGACVNVPAVSGAPFQLTNDGAGIQPFDRGLYSPGAGFFGFRQGGDALAVGAYDTTTMRPSVRRWTALAHLTYDLTDTISGFVEGSYANTKGVNPVANGSIGPYALEVGNYVYVGSHIAQDNAYLSPAVAAAIGPHGAQFGRNMVNVQNARNATGNETWRTVAGLNGNIGPRWAWDVYYTHGENKNDQHLTHNVVGSYLNYALDAVRDGTGKIVCGVYIPGRINPATGTPYTAADVTKANNCVPLNLFGIGHADQAAIDYAFRTLEEFNTTKQDVFAANFRGDLSDGWGAGPIKLAVGAEWRKESVLSTHNLANSPWYNDFTLSYGLDYGGSIRVLEGYGELNVPVFRDWALGKYFELDLAARETQTKNHGTLGQYAGSSSTRDFMTWKINGVWDLTDWLRFRATRSRDVRAPQFRELYQTYAPRVGGPFGSVSNPWNAGITDAAIVTTGGNIDLKPEKADTWTIGAVLSPKSGFLSRFRFSADWYQIEIKDAIAGPPTGVGAQNIVTQCYNELQAGTQNGPFCSLMTGEGTNDIQTIVSVAGNVQAFTTRGIDFEASYTAPLGNGSISVRALASYLYDQLFNGTNYAGQTGPTGAFGSFNTSPYWQGNLILTGKQGPFTGTIQVRYVGPGRYFTITPNGGAAVDPGDAGYSTTNPDSINDNSVSSATYVNLSASYDILDGVQLFGSINNLFDLNPPIAPGGNGYPTNPVYFDTYGRSWRVGVRVKI
jgi:outer membrane receptor protein involved in Fe transport